MVDIHTLEDGLLLLEGGSAAAWSGVVAQYGGPLAGGLVVHEAPEFEIWLATERERLAASLSAPARAAHRAPARRRRLAIGDRAGAARAGRRPPARTNPPALIESQLRLGQRAQAAHQYATLADLLERELAVAPLPETTARYEALIANAPLRAAPQLPAAQRIRRSPCPSSAARPSLRCSTRSTLAPRRVQRGWC